MSEEHLRILSLEASNVKKITAVHITPKGNVITLTGPNGSGKSSVLDAIWMALAGKTAMPEQPIRRGASKSETKLEIGNAAGEVQFIATRKITTTGTTITLTGPDGKKHETPQTLLDRMVGNLAFDPIQFVRMDDRPRLETLRRLVGLDFSKQDAMRQALYDERTGENRDALSAKNRLAALKFDKTAPEKPTDVDDLVRELSAANETNNQNRVQRDALSDRESDLADASDAVKKATVALDEAKANLAMATAKYKTADQQLEAQKSKVQALADVDVESIKTKIGAVGEVNRKVQSNADYKRIQKEMGAAEVKSDGLTKQIEALDKAKSDALAKAKFPLKELSFDDNGVLLNGLPFAQASTGEQLRASVAVGMALNPKLHVIFIRDGSLLDDTGLEMISEMAATNDYQVWMEDARSKDKTAIVIEDGHIKEDAGEEAPE